MRLKDCIRLAYSRLSSRLKRSLKPLLSTFPKLKDSLHHFLHAPLLPYHIESRVSRLRNSRVVHVARAPKHICTRYAEVVARTRHPTTKCRVHRIWSVNRGSMKKRVWARVKEMWWVTWPADWMYCWYERRRDAKPPKITRRKSLSLGKAEIDEAGSERTPLLRHSVLRRRRKGKMCDQDRSLFFRLPAELRNKIYAEVFDGLSGDGRVYIHFLDGRLRSYRAVVDASKTVTASPTPGLCVLPLISTCRQIYTETISLVYSTPTFIFNHPSIFLLFVYLIPTPHFHALSKIYLDFAGYAPKLVVRHPRSTTVRRFEFREPLSYHAPHTSLHSHFFNTALKHIPPPQPSSPGNETRHTFWTAISRILERVEGLRELRASLRTALVEEMLRPLYGVREGRKVKRVAVETFSVSRSSNFARQERWEGGVEGGDGDGTVRGGLRRVGEESEYFDEMEILGVRSAE